MPMTQDEKDALIKELQAVGMEAVSESRFIRGASTIEAIRYAVTQIEAIVSSCEEREIEALIKCIKKGKKQ